MARTLREPLLLMGRVDAADGELRLWYLLLVTWRALGLAVPEDATSRLGAHGALLQGLRERLSVPRGRRPAPEDLFQAVTAAMVAHHELEGLVWEMASRFSEEHGVTRKGWAIPPEWR
jgi:hypothetical protein